MHGPSFLQEPPASLEFTNSSGAILNCIGQGNPVPEVRWVDITNKELTTIPQLRYDNLVNNFRYSSIK